MTNTHITTATLDLSRWVELLAFDPNSASVLVRDEDGDEFEVHVDRLDAFDLTDLDLLPLEVE